MKLGIDPKVMALVRMVIDPRIPGAHAICPYSNAIRSNADVAISVLGPESRTDRFHASSSEEGHENRRDQE